MKLDVLNLIFIGYCLDFAFPDYRRAPNAKGPIIIRKEIRHTEYKQILPVLPSDKVSEKRPGKRESKSNFKLEQDTVDESKDGKKPKNETRIEWMHETKKNEIKVVPEEKKTVEAGDNGYKTHSKVITKEHVEVQEINPNAVFPSDRVIVKGSYKVHEVDPNMQTTSIVHSYDSPTGKVMAEILTELDQVRRKDDKELIKPEETTYQPLGREKEFENLFSYDPFTEEKESRDDLTFEPFDRTEKPFSLDDLFEEGNSDRYLFEPYSGDNSLSKIKAIETVRNTQGENKMFPPFKKDASDTRYNYKPYPNDGPFYKNARSFDEFFNDDFKLNDEAESKNGAIKIKEREDHDHDMELYKFPNLDFNESEGTGNDETHTAATTRNDDNNEEGPYQDFTGYHFPELHFEVTDGKKEKGSQSLTLNRKNQNDHGGYEFPKMHFDLMNGGKEEETKAARKDNDESVYDISNYHFPQVHFQVTDGERGVESKTVGATKSKDKSGHGYDLIYELPNVHYDDLRNAVENGQNRKTTAKEQHDYDLIYDFPKVHYDHLKEAIESKQVIQTEAPESEEYSDLSSQDNSEDCPYEEYKASETSNPENDALERYLISKIYGPLYNRQ